MAENERGRILNYIDLHKRLYDIDYIRDEIRYQLALETQIAIKTGEFHPPVIQGTLRRMQSDKYLVAVPMSTAIERVGIAICSVLPQTDWKTYAFTVAAVIEPDEESFANFLSEEWSITPQENDQNLEDAGLMASIPLGESVSATYALLKKHKLYSKITRRIKSN